MAREKFVDISFKPATLERIAQANAIIAEYQAQGFTLTLRQLYYQFVARALIPNRMTEYKRLGATVDSGRKAGLIDWSAIEDRTRNLQRTSVWESPREIMLAVAQQYREDWWREQPRYVEVWIEKDALIGVIEEVCNTYRVPYFACRGYPSQSELYDAGKRLYREIRQGREPIILHLGDHDPSGIDMTRDLEDRLAMFTRYPVQVNRLALNMPQVETYNPPPNPAKTTDSRFQDYEARFGEESWELDALEPQVIAGLIGDAIREEIDWDRWEVSEREEKISTTALALVERHWDEVSEHVRDQFLDDNEEDEG